MLLHTYITRSQRQKKTQPSSIELEEPGWEGGRGDPRPRSSGKWHGLGLYLQRTNVFTPASCRLCMRGVWKSVRVCKRQRSVLAWRAHGHQFCRKRSGESARWKSALRSHPLYTVYTCTEPRRGQERRTCSARKCSKIWKYTLVVSHTDDVLFTAPHDNFHTIIVIYFNELNSWSGNFFPHFHRSVTV